MDRIKKVVVDSYNRCIVFVKKHKDYFVIGSVIFLLLLVGLSIIWFNRLQRYKTKTYIPKYGEDCITFKYQREKLYNDTGEIEIKDKDEISKIKNFGTFKQVSIKSTPDKRYTAEIISSKTEDRLVLTDVESRITVEIYKSIKRYSTEKNYEKESNGRITSFDFSPDSQSLSYTSDDGVWIYDLKNKNTKVVVYNYNVGFGVKDYYFYSTPIFSNDLNYLAFMKGYYEGGQYYIYDLNNNKIINLDKDISWSTFVGFGVDSALFVNEFDEDVSLFDFNSSKLTLIYQQPEKNKNLLTKAYFKNKESNQVMIITTKKTSSDTNLTCLDSRNNKEKIFAEKESLQLIDPMTNRKYEILNLDITKGGMRIGNATNFIHNKKEYVLVRFVGNGGWEMYGFVDPQEPNKLWQIKFTE